MFPRTRLFLALLGPIGRKINDRKIGLIAAGLAFYGLLAVFPAITSVVTLWGFFADPDLVEQQVATFEPMMPQEAFAILKGQVEAIASGPKEVLGWASIASTGAALWATRAGVAAMIGGMNAVYDVPPRGGLRGLGMALLLTLVLIAVMLVALAAVVIAPVLLSFVPLGPYAGLALDVLRWGVSAAVTLTGIGLLYRLAPHRTGKRSPLYSRGAWVAAVLWAVVSFGFSTYLQHFNNYNQVYGSLGAVIAMLMWFYLSGYVVLLGGLVNAELEAPSRKPAPTPVQSDGISQQAPDDLSLGADTGPDTAAAAAAAAADGVPHGGATAQG